MKEKTKMRRTKAANNLELVRSMIGQFVGDKEGSGMKGSIGDLCRLISLEKELTVEEPLREIKVTWLMSSGMVSEK